MLIGLDCLILLGPHAPQNVASIRGLPSAAPYPRSGQLLMKIRVLLVDDHQRWRRYITSVLRENPSYQVIAEVGDGLEAVQSVERLKPDLVLLDVGLPTLNGIEVARRISPISPHSHILFLSEHRSWDIAEAALRAGADGYLIKTEAGLDLLPAMNAVMQELRFVSAGLTGREVQKFDDSRSARDSHSGRRHAAGFCSSEIQLLDECHCFWHPHSRREVQRSWSCRPHAGRRGIRSCVRADWMLTSRRGRKIRVAGCARHSADIHREWLVGRARFWKSATALYEAAARASTAKNGAPRVAACGDCAPTLWESGNAAAAIRLEYLWDEFARAHDVEILCGYVLAAVPPIDETRAFRRVCAVHAAVHSR